MTLLEIWSKVNNFDWLLYFRKIRQIQSREQKNWIDKFKRHHKMFDQIWQVKKASSIKFQEAAAG